MDGSNASARQDSGDDQDAIASPWAAHRGLLATVIGMGVAIVIGLAVVVYGILYRMSAGEESTAAGGTPAAAPYARSLDLHPGPAGIRSFAVGDRLAIEARAPDGRTVVVLIDPETGRETGRILLAPPEAERP